jgi:hypothetical protein
MAKKKKKKKKKKKTGITTRRASNQCKTSDRGCYAVKRFSTKERPMLSFEQYGSFDIKRMFGDQEVEHKCILPNTQFQSDISLNSHNHSYHAYLFQICKFSYSFPQ